jgi:hypothetical protein
MQTNPKHQDVKKLFRSCDGVVKLTVHFDARPPHSIAFNPTNGHPEGASD